MGGTRTSHAGSTAHGKRGNTVTVTSHEVARLAGVSQPTVSRALRADSQVSEKTRAKVRAAAEELGYIPSERGRSLSTRSTHQIAMVAAIDNPLYPSLLPPLHDTLQRKGYRLVLLAEKDDEMVSDERLVDGSVDGVVLTTTQLRSPLPDQLRRRSVPFVELNRTSDMVESDRVTADNGAGGRAVADLFAAGGHRQVAALLGPELASSSREREAGFRAGLRKSGITLPKKFVRRVWFSEEQGRSAMDNLLDEAGEVPTAVFCVNDMVAVGAINALAAHGLAAGRDVAVVGFDDLAIASWPTFDLTTVRVDFPAMATRAAELLLERIAAPNRPWQHETFDVQLSVRTSHLR